MKLPVTLTPHPLSILKTLLTQDVRTGVVVGKPEIMSKKRPKLAGDMCSSLDWIKLAQNTVSYACIFI